MLKVMKGLIDVKKLENSTEEDQANNFLKVMSYIFLALNAIALIFYMVVSGGTYDPSIHFQVGTFQLISLGLLYSKYRKFGGYFFLIVLWSGMVYDSFSIGGIYNPINYAFIMITTLAVITFDARKAVIFAIATTLVYACLYGLSIAEYYPNRIIRMEPISASAYFINHVTVLWFVVFMQSLRKMTVDTLFKIIKDKDAALRKSEYLYRSIVEGDRDLYVIRFKPDGTVLFVNDAFARVYGIDKQKIVGQSIYQFVTSENEEAARAFNASITKDHPIDKYRHEFKSKDNKTEWQEWTTQIIINGTTEYQSTGRSLNDQIETDKIIFQMGLNQAKMEMVEQLASEISHDIRTPLTVLNTSLYLLKKSDSLDNQKKYLSQISDVSTDLQKMIENLVSIIKINDPGSDQGMTNIDLSKLVKRITEESEYLLKTGQKLEPYIEPDVVIDGNYNFLTRALNNLVVNAIQYTPNGGIINVSLKSEADKAIIKIVDNGIGIPTEDLDKIFDRLYRSNNAKTFFENGSGLGLYIVKMVVNKHGGQIEVKSEVGQGTTFIITIPNQQNPDTSSIGGDKQITDAMSTIVTPNGEQIAASDIGIKPVVSEVVVTNLLPPPPAISKVPPDPILPAPTSIPTPIDKTISE